MQKGQIFDEQLDVEQYQIDGEETYDKCYDKSMDSLFRHMPEEIKIDFDNATKDIKVYIRFLHLVLDYVLYFGKMDEWDFVNRFKNNFVEILNKDKQTNK